MSKRAASVTTGTPVNAVNATETLTLSGVVIDGESLTINNLRRPETVDVYEFLADTLLTKTAPNNIGVNINAYTTKATGTLTLPTQPSADDAMVIGVKTYTFVAHGTAENDGDIDVGTDLASAKLAIVAAINGTDGVNTPHPSVRAAAFVVNDCTITALIGGVAGNSIATTETFDAVGNVFGDTALGTGTDCSAANAVTALVAAITASDTQGVGAADGEGDTVVLTADLAGAAGNNISVVPDMANGTLTRDAVALSGGIDGTEARPEEMMIDSSYLYVAVDRNTKSGKNWRRISIGTAF